MAEQNLEITYIPYGLDEISLLDLMTSLANGIEGYLGSKRWARKDKYRNAWLAAYLDIINHGLTGASNETGVWTINHGQSPINLNDMSNTEREMYLDAAYYIQLKMSLMTPRKKEEEKKKEDLEKYGSFKDNLMKRILNRRYGGTEKENLTLFLDPEQGWDAQDARGTNGLRGTEKRKGAMIAELEAYKRDLDNQDLNYNFEGTSFKDKADLLSKIQAAIDALRDTPNDESDDLPAFNALGLPYRSFFSNGGNDIYGTTEDGKQVTYLQYYENQLKEAQKKQKAEQEKLKAQQANYWKGYKTPNFSKINGRPLKQEESNINYLSQLFSKGNWNGDEASQIISAFKLAEKNGQLIPLSKEELAKLNPSIWGNRAKYLRKINGINSPLYYDTLNKLFKYFYNLSSPQISFLDILDLNNPELLEKKRLELQNSKKLKDEDWDIIGADTVSMLGDLVSLGGGYAGAAGGITTILSDLYSDIKRGKDFWDVTKNLAKNTAWGFAGLIPGVKLAKLGKRAAQLYALYNSWGIITDPDVHKSWKKLINGEDFTSHDFENLKWTLHAVTGAHNTARSHFSDSALLNKLGNKNKIIVETKNGKRTITTELQKEINKAGGRGGLEAANKKFQEYTKNEAKEGSFEFNTTGRKWYNPSRYSQRLRNAVSNEAKLEGTPTQASKMTIGRMLVLDRNKPIIANPFSSNTYKNWWTSGGPNKGYTTMALGKMYLNINNSKQNILSNTKSQSEIEKEPKKWSQSTEAKEYREMLKGNYSNNAILGGVHKIGDLTINVDIPRPGANQGFAEVTFSNGNKLTIRFDNLKLLQENIAKIVKERRVQIDSSGKKTKIDTKEMGKILRSLRAKGFLKQGGLLNSSLDTIIEDFIKNNNI